jgi:hypothetical protein
MRSTPNTNANDRLMEPFLCDYEELKIVGVFAKIFVNTYHSTLGRSSQDASAS